MMFNNKMLLQSSDIKVKEDPYRVELDKEQQARMKELFRRKNDEQRGSNVLVNIRTEEHRRSMTPSN